MKIALLYCENLQSDLLYSRLIRDFSNSIIEVIEMPAIPRNTSGKVNNKFLLRILKSSKSYLAFNALTILVYRIISPFSPNKVSKVASRNRVSVKKVTSIDPQFVNHLKSQDLDFIINGTGNILKQNFLDIPRFGVLNFHCAKLPQYRGAANYFWMLVNKEESGQGTLHYVNTSIDSGDIIDFTSPVPIQKNMSVFELWSGIRLRANRCIQKNLQKFNEIGHIEATPQDETKAVYRSFPQRSDSRALRENGFKTFKLSDFGLFWKILFRNLEDLP